MILGGVNGLKIEDGGFGSQRLAPTLSHPSIGTAILGIAASALVGRRAGRHLTGLFDFSFWTFDTRSGARGFIEAPNYIWE